MTPNELLEGVITQLFNTPIGKNGSIESISGGCINHAGKFEHEGKNYFLKWNQNAQDLFEKERMGLEILEDAKCLRIPKIVGCGQVHQFDFLCLEYISQINSSKQYWEKFGTELSNLHKETADYFGLKFDNHIGRLHQTNTEHKLWEDFFIQERLVPQVNIALNKGLLNTKQANEFDMFYELVPDFFPKETPALLHGDLWSGNIICGENNLPYLIDPAVYYGHREMELAFTQLFGGFDKIFYDAYHASYPLEKEFNKRVEIYNLYPLLVHLNLFGTSYLAQIVSTLKRFI
ncbi:MAG: fructosamine kinase family protein [Reichenbachiella sp.]